jgi:hypothetical protein
MSKIKGQPVRAVNFPKSLLVAFVAHGTDDEFLAVGATPAELNEFSDRTVRTARYVLAGEGVIQHSAPQYVEDQRTE